MGPESALNPLNIKIDLTLSINSEPPQRNQYRCCGTPQPQLLVHLYQSVNAVSCLKTTPVMSLLITSSPPDREQP